MSGHILGRLGRTRDALEEYHAGEKTAAEHGDLINLLRCKTGLVELTAPGPDQASRQKDLSDTYNSFSQGLDCADLQRASRVLRNHPE
jgi:hypothetical protein